MSGTNTNPTLEEVFELARLLSTSDAAVDALAQGMRENRWSRVWDDTPYSPDVAARMWAVYTAETQDPPLEVPPVNAEQKVWLIDFETPTLGQKARLDAVSETLEKSAASAAAKPRGRFSRR